MTYFLIYLILHTTFLPASCTLKFTNVEKKVVLTDSTNSIKRVKDFLFWYKENKKLINIQLVKIPSEEDTTSYYEVNFSAVRSYLKSLEISGFFSAKFLASLNNYIKRCDLNLKKYPQRDFIAQGFESDLVMRMVDEKGILDDINSLKTISVKYSDPNHIELILKNKQKIKFYLAKIKGIWKIDSINEGFSMSISHY